MAESEKQPALPAEGNERAEGLNHSPSRPKGEPLADLAPAGRDVALQAGRRLFARPPQFLRGVADMIALPPAHEVEIAFAGRSNVGKSSLINALFNRRDVARTSNTPGRTRELNYFRLADPRLALVDMPGYGYAKAPKSMVKKWQALVRDFLRGRVPLRRVFLLIDARHGIKPQDEEAMRLLDEAAVNYQLVVTKADKVSGGHVSRLLAILHEALSTHPAAHPAVHVTSARKGTGIDLLRAEITLLLPDVTAAAAEAEASGDDGDDETAPPACNRR